MTKIFLILLSVFVLRGVVHAADTIRIAVPEPNATYMTFPLAHKKGFLTGGLGSRGRSDERHPHDAGVKYGDIDYLTGLPVGVRGDRRLPLKIVACYLPKSSLMMISRPEINSVKELKGKTVAVSSFGTPTPARCS